jgi:hypothetical protein
VRCLVALLLAACSSSGVEDRSLPPAATAPPASPAASDKAPRFTWPVPDGWRSETIPFPLEFAPDIPHRGVEELRFAPDFFKPESPGYWTYAFAWIVTGATPLDLPRLERELTAYFRGLTAAVARDKKDLPPLDLDRIEVRIGSDGRGSARTFDAFGDGRQIDLDIAVRVQPCGPGRAVLVSAARRGQSPLTPSLEEVVQSFRCEGKGS